MTQITSLLEAIFITSGIASLNLIIITTILVYKLLQFIGKDELVDSKICEWCKSRIRDDAIVCRYCGREEP